MIGVRVSNDGARAFAESLDEVVQQSQNTLEQVKQQKLRQQEVMISSGWNNAGQCQANQGYPSIQNCRQKTPSNVNRPASASRMPANRLSQNQQPSIVSKSLEDPHEQSAHKSQLANQSISRKMGLFEDRLRKLEKSSTKHDESLQEIIIKLEHLGEGQKGEKRNYHSLREQIAGLKTRMELLLSQEELRGKISSSHASAHSTTNALNLDSDWLQQLIAQRVTREVNRAVSEALASRSSPIRATHTTNNQNDVNNGASISSHQVQDQVSILEKETLRLNSEFERIRSKQVYLDRIYSELKESLSARDTHLQEAHKKQLQSYRVDFDNLQNASKKVIQDVTQTIDVRTLEIHSLRDIHEKHVENISSILAELDLRLLTTSSTLQTTQNQVAMLKNKENETENRVSELEQSLPLFLTEIEKIFGLRQALAEAMTKLDGHTKNLEMQNTQIQTLTQNLGSLSESVDSLGQGMKAKLESLEQKNDVKVQYLHSQHEMTVKNNEEVFEKVRDHLSYLRTRQADLTKDIASLQSTREELVSSMQTFNRQIEEEASRSFELTVTLQRLQTGQESLENDLDKLTKDQNRLNEELRSTLDAQSEEMHVTLDTLSQGTKEEVQHSLDLFSAQQSLSLATIESKVDDVLQPLQVLELGFEGLEGRVLVVETRLDEFEDRHGKLLEHQQKQQQEEEDLRSMHSKVSTGDNNNSSSTKNNMSPKKPNAPRSSPSSPSHRHQHQSSQSLPFKFSLSSTQRDSRDDQEDEEEEDTEEENKGALSAINTMLETANFHVHALTVHLAMQQHSHQQQPQQQQSSYKQQETQPAPPVAPSTPASSAGAIGLAAAPAVAAAQQLSVPIDYGFDDFKREFNFASPVATPVAAPPPPTESTASTSSVKPQQIEPDPVIERATKLLARLTAIEEEATSSAYQHQAHDDEEQEEEEVDVDAIMMAALPSEEEFTASSHAQEMEDDLIMLAQERRGSLQSIAEEEQDIDDNDDAIMLQGGEDEHEVEDRYDDENMSHNSWDHIEFADQGQDQDNHHYNHQPPEEQEEQEEGYADTGDELQALLQRQRLARQQRQPEIFGLQAFKAAAAVDESEQKQQSHKL